MYCKFEDMELLAGKFGEHILDPPLPRIIEFRVMNPGLSEIEKYMGQICTKCNNFFTKYSFVLEKVPVKYIEPIKIYN